MRLDGKYERIRTYIIYILWYICDTVVATQYSAIEPDEGIHQFPHKCKNACVHCAKTCSSIFRLSYLAYILFICIYIFARNAQHVVEQNQLHSRFRILLHNFIKTRMSSEIHSFSCGSCTLLLVATRFAYVVDRRFLIEIQTVCAHLRTYFPFRSSSSVISEYAYSICWHTPAGYARMHHDNTDADKTRSGWACSRRQRRATAGFLMQQPVEKAVQAAQAMAAAGNVTISVERAVS